MNKQELTTKEIENFTILFKQMVLSNKPETILAAIHMAESLDSEVIYDIMLEGIKIDKHSKRLLPSSFFQDKGLRGSVPKEWGTPSKLGINTKYIINDGIHAHRLTAMTGILNAASKYPKWQSFTNDIKELRTPCYHLDYLNCFKNVEVLFIENGGLFDRGLSLDKLETIFWYMFHDKYMEETFTYKNEGISIKSINQCTNLKTLEIEGCKKHTEYTGLILKEGFDGIEKLHNLEVLIIENLSGNFDQGFIPLSMCKKLKHLSINNKSDEYRVAFTKSINKIDNDNYYLHPDKYELGIYLRNSWAELETISSKDKYPAVEIMNLKGLENLNLLRNLTLKGFHSLSDTKALSDCKELQEIRISSHSLNILTLPNQLPGLKKLNLKCRELERITIKEYPEALEEIIIESSKFRFGT
jgi:hypothetical protein